MGARRLAQTLVVEHLLTNPQVVAALQRQTLIGGSLDTNILELQLLHEKTLLGAMARAYGTSAADKAQLGRVGMHLARLFPLAFAQAFELVPLRLEEQTLVVVSCEPPDEGKMARIWEQYQLHVVAHVTIEARLHQAMQRLYGVAPEPRFAQLLVLLDGFEGLATAGTALDMLGLEAEIPAQQPPEHRTEDLLDGPSEGQIPAGLEATHAGWAAEQVAARWIAAAPPEGVAPAKATPTADLTSIFETAESHDTIGLAHTATFAEATSSAQLGANSAHLQPFDAASHPSASQATAAGQAATASHRGLLKEAVRRLEAEPNRERAIGIIVTFAHAMFDYIAVFVMHGSHPHGWHSTPSGAIARLDSIDAQLFKDSVLRTIYETQSPYLGPLPEHADNGRFLQHIARPWPKVACLTPILVGGRMAALVYADNGARHVSPKKVAALMILLQRCGMAWERLIRHRKHPPRSASSLEDVPNNAQTAARGPTSSAYVMFSDVADNPQQSLGDWEDVFVEVSQQDTPDPMPRAPKPSARWSDVIALAHAASRLLPVLDHAPHTDQALVQTWIAALDSPHGATRQNAMGQLLNLGNRTDAACQEAFPGALTCDMWAPDATLPAFGRCSGLCHLLVSRGRAATAAVLPHLASEDRTKRLMAVYFFQAVHDSAGCPGLTLCLYDAEKRIRGLAIETLRHYKNDLSYAYTVQVLRQQLLDPTGQRFAIQTLGQLREIFAVPALIPLVAATDTEIARAAASALAVICGQSFGPDVERWQVWWQGHHYQPRSAWLMAGLSHANPTIRRVAHQELQHITGQVLDFDPQASAQEREQRAQVWQHWLQTHDLDANWHPTTVRA